MITFVNLAERGSHSYSAADDQWGGAKRVLREMTQLARRALAGGFEMEKTVAVRTRSVEILHQL